MATPAYDLWHLKNNNPAAQAGFRNVNFQISAPYSSTALVNNQTVPVTAVDISAEEPNFGGVNPQSGTSYTLQASDEGMLVVFTNSSAVAVTLPNTLPNYFRCTLLFLGAAGGTLTPSTGTVNGVASETCVLNQGGEAFFNGTNWWFVTSAGGGGFTAGGDLSGTSTSQEVVGILSKAIDGTTPANGQVLQYSSTTGKWELVTLTGSGGAAGDANAEYIIGAADSGLPNAAVIPGFYGSADKQPATAGSLDDEFPGSSLSGSWTWVNQGTAAVTIANSYCVITGPADSTTNIRYIYKTAPSTPWEVTMQIACFCYEANYWQGGMVLADSSGKLITCMYKYSSQFSIEITYFNSPTSVVSAAEIWPTPLRDGYMKVKDDGTNLTFSFSIRGQGWEQILQVSRTTWLTSGPSAVGFGVGAYDAKAVILETDWFRRTL